MTINVDYRTLKKGVLLAGLAFVGLQIAMTEVVAVYGEFVGWAVGLVWMLALGSVILHWT